MIGAARIEMMDEVEAGHARHTDVGYDAVELHAAVDRSEKGFGRSKASRLEVLAGQIELQGIEHGRIVLDQRDLGRLSHWAGFLRRKNWRGAE
jgi:hypothetical protein